MFLSKKTKIFLMMLIVLTLMSISSIHASDLDNLTIENDQITTTDNITRDNDAIHDENPPGTFDDLREDIGHLSSGGVFNVTRDYHFAGSKCDPDGENRGITISANNITIIGNGHTIDGDHQSAFFMVTGDNVKIYNLTFMNGQYHGKTIKMSVYKKDSTTDWVTYYYTNDVSPIDWVGNKGVIADCIFYGNVATNGAAITWEGNNGLITNSLFLSNYARGAGGAILVKGKNDTIKDSVFLNSTSQLSGEAIYLDPYQRDCNITGLFAKEIPFIDGKVTGIDVNYMNYELESIVADYKIDLFKMIYSSITNNYTHYYGENLVFFSGYNGTDFILNFARSFDEFDIIYGKSYHFTDVSNYNEIFRKALVEDYKYEVTYIKNMMVYNQKDYDKARTATDSVFKVDSFQNTIEEDLKSMSSYSPYKQLLVTFGGQYRFTSRETWNPSNSFNMIHINGNGSTIAIHSDYNDEFEWAHLENTKCIFSACNLKLQYFNMAVENIGCTCVFNNVTFANNRMDYWFKQDYGAAICNTGTCVCNNCTFTNNYCKNGGAIFSQGYLEINNCTFKGNYAYGHGDNIFNADNGIVKFNGVEIKSTKDYVYCDKSISKKDITVLSCLSAALAAGIGFTIGTIFGSPIIGIALGTIAGGIVGSITAGYICSRIYDVTFDRTNLCVCIIIACAVTGAAGGALGGYLTAIPDGWTPTYELYDADVCIASSASSDDISVCTECPAVQEYLNTEVPEDFAAEIRELIKNAPKAIPGA